MRWVAVLLIVVNLALWLYLANQPVPAVSSESDGRLPRVAELEVMGEPAGEPVSGPMATDEARGGIERAPAELAGEVPVSKVEPEEATEVAGATADEPSDPDVTQATSSQELEREPPIALRQPTDYCLELGWFDDENEALGALGQIEVAGKVAELTVEERTRELTPLHWVIIPPLSSRQEALTLFRSIQRQGIDSYLVTEGEQENAISLGLFESREAAEGVLAKRNSENLNAVLAFFPRNQISYALVFRAVYVPESEEQSRDLAEFESQFEMVKISRCEGVATAEKNP